MLAASAPEGIVYSASGELYVAEAIRSARSSLRRTSLPHVLFASSDAERALAACEGLEGLSVMPFEPSENPYLDKIANMRRSPFERTLYLDTDTFVVEDVAHLLRLLDRYDLAAAHTAEGRGPRDPDVPPAFYEFNTGVLAWSASERTAAFMESWEETYRRWFEHGDPFPTPGHGSRSGRADQLAFRRCAWERDVAVFVLAPEYNFRVGYPTTVGCRVAIIHGRHSDYEGLAARLNAHEVPRSWPPPLSLRAKVMRRVRKLAPAQRTSS
ncbi:MAG TPA: hypothetical protein VL972_07235 [Solirubrobacteraceae bacterium]|nr:hypothetical protein [Solirubrobacteraceae bacterium]